MNCRRRGSAIVELTLLVPLLVSLFLGVWQFGYAYYIYNELEQAVRAGARYGSVRKYDVAGYTEAVQKMVVYGNPGATPGTTPALVPNLNHRDVTVQLLNASGGAATGTPATVQVSISRYEIGTLWTITLNGKPSISFPYVGG